jgi:uncharacterized membrane protein
MTTRDRGRRRSRGWPVPLGLAALSFVPLTAGTLRLVQLAGGPELLPDSSRFDAFPVALVVHILGAAVFALVGMFQLVPGIRRKHRTWHRRAGRVVAAAGLAVAGSALWLTLFYEAQPGTGSLLYVLRLVLSSAMVACIVLGLTAIRRRDIAAHRAWMIRGFALGLGAGTQVFTEGLGSAVLGTGVIAGDLAKAAGWVINIAVAEWVVRRPARRRKRRTVARAAVLTGASS